MSKRKRISIVCVLALLVIAIVAGWVLLNQNSEQGQASTPRPTGTLAAGYKPVIYLYPEESMHVAVYLDARWDLTYTYPQYQDGWQVMAHPDGTLINDVDAKEYSYLFWEGVSDVEYDMSQGFVVKGEDTASFLQEKLAYLGLAPREYNEMIVYWLPQMQDNAYNLITFQEQAYLDSAKLVIEPAPDSILRVFMVFKALEKPVDIPPQQLASFVRKGFTVIEWGGTQIQ